MLLDALVFISFQHIPALVYMYFYVTIARRMR